jgi:5-methylcytosine rRNA methyltransferase NSUN4
MKKQKLCGPDGFDRFYSGLIGPRWPVLREALLSSPSYTELGQPLKKSYFLDRASVIAAKALCTGPDDIVLDMCAAPGGKTLVLAGALTGSGKLIANERSSARRARLIRVIDEHLDKIVQSKIKVTGHDARKWGMHQQDVYDRILLDIPCSSERHIIGSQKHLERWTEARTRNLAGQAYAFLVAGITALKPGGTLLYCTCSISDLENDEVIRKFMKKKKNTAEVVLPSPAPGAAGEQSDFGLKIWPDIEEGSGPIYYAILRKSIFK